MENEAGGAHFTYLVDVTAPPQRIGIVVDDGHAFDSGSVAGRPKDESTEIMTVAAGEPLFEVECVVVANPVAQVSLMRP